MLFFVVVGEEVTGGGLCKDSSLTESSELVDRLDAELDMVGRGGGGWRFLCPNAPRNERRAVESSAEKAAAALD